MRTTAVVVGAGQAGLAMSRCLTERCIDHVVLERGEVANSWRTERWDSLRLLTPNWQSRLPGHRYEGGDPDGFMTVGEVTTFLAGYADAFDAPVRTDTAVTSVAPDGADGYVVETSQGTWRCRVVVVASGACNTAVTPPVAADLPGSVTSLTPGSYRNPSHLEDGGVLVAGAAASGIQLAREIHASGRPVTLAVGGHVRVPRTYRGMDIMWWLDAAGVLDERYDSDGVDDITRARGVPSFQLVGSDDHETIDLNVLQAEGVRVVGRFAGLRGSVAQFSGSLRNVCTLADLKLGRLLDTIDQWATDNGFDGELDSPERMAPTVVDRSPALSLDLEASGITTVLWATGYRPDMSWLHLPVFDSRARVVHDGGVARTPGLYIMGMPFLRRRKSTLIDGAGDDARDLSAHMAGYLAGPGIKRSTTSVHA